MKKNLVLLGMMGVGKTTLGKIVAEKQKINFVDIDLNIEKKNSMKIKDIFEKKGEDFFRSEEQKEVVESMKKNDCVIALGGGAFINKTIRESVLKNGISIWLDVDVNTLNKRVRWNKKRPLLNEKNNLKKLNELYSKRKKIYKLSNYKIVCKNRSKKDIVEEIISIYEKH